MRKVKLDSVEHYRVSDVGEYLLLSRGLMAKILKDLPEVKVRSVGRTLFLPCSSFQVVKESAEKRHDDYINGCRERANKLNDKIRSGEIPPGRKKVRTEEKEVQAQQDTDLDLKNKSRLDSIESRLQNIEALLVRLSKIWE